MDDSPVARRLPGEDPVLDPAIEVAGTAAADGNEAVRAAARLRPDLITMDIYMPEMDGLAAIQEIMATVPRPILVVTSDRNSKLAYRSLACGALDVLEKPGFVEDATPETYAELLGRVRLLSKVKVITHVRGRRQKWSEALPPIPPGSDEAPAHHIVAIGASTGGPSVIAKILGELKADVPAGFVIVQHLSEGFTQGLVQWLDEVTPLKVKEAMHGDVVEPGVAYVAPADSHAELASGARIFLSKKPLLRGHRPSADLLFSSLARTMPRKAIGVILTGMGMDGAEGLSELKRAGGRTIAQSEESCLIFGMPKVAIELGAAERILPAEGIAEEIARLCRP
ncbi:MAG: chemotaxis-specific protein-glutamate methyltransferase CheB [Acidobacteriota bacterium]